MVETLFNLARESGHDMTPRFEASLATSMPTGAHVAASGTAKEFANWDTSHGSADADLLPDLATIRSRSRDIVRNNGIASGAIQTLQDNVVGAGPKLIAIPDYRALGITPEQAEQWAQTVQSRFRAYFETTEIDASEKLTGPAMSTHIFRNGMVNGDAITLPLWIPRQGSQFATRFQVIESDRLCNPDNTADTDKLRGGVEIDRFGRAMAYHIRTVHPGDRLGFIFDISGKWQRIPARTDWGRQRVLHHHDSERAGQTRGKPILAPVLAPIRMLDVYHRTEMQAAAVNAFIAAFMETNVPPEMVGEMLGADPTDERFQNYVEMQNQYVAPIRGAAIIPTMPGTKITPFAPARPADAFGPFTSAIARHIGVGLGLPPELLMKDFSTTNYSSGRMALSEAFRFFLGRRRWMQDLWLNPMYQLWLEEQVASGMIEAPGFYENRYAWCRAKWIWPGRGWIDPVKEAQAAEKRLVLGLSTLADECAEQGADWEDVQQQRAREARVLKQLGLPPVGTPAAQPPQPQQMVDTTDPAADQTPDPGVGE